MSDEVTTAWLGVCTADIPWNTYLLCWMNYRVKNTAKILL